MLEVLIALFTFVGYAVCCLTVGIVAGVLFWSVDTRWERNNSIEEAEANK